MLGAGFYPITIAEMHSYSKDADRLFKGDEHERVKGFLALHPEFGDVLPGTGGVRRLRWPIKNPKKAPRLRVIYYFRDLNMPLYLLALYAPSEQIPLNAGWRAEIERLVNELLLSYGKRWAQVVSLETGA